MSSQQKQLQVKRKYDYPLRPVRKAGEPIPGNKVKLITNLYKLSIKQNSPIYFYVIEINQAAQDDGDKSTGDRVVKPPRKLPAQMRREILESALKAWIKNNRPKTYDAKRAYNYVYDNKISALYTLFNIFSENQKNLKLEIKYEDKKIYEGKLVKESNDFVVSFSKGQKLDMNRCVEICKSGETGTPEAIAILRMINTIVRGQIVEIPDFVLTNTNIFPFKTKYQFDADGTIIANHGMFVSAKFTESGACLNIANTLACFYKDLNLADYVVKKYGNQWLTKDLPTGMIDEIKKELKNKQINAKHRNYGTVKDRPHYRKYRIEDINFNGLHKFPFIPKGSTKPTEITIQQYFEKEYNYKLKYPRLPCIVDKGRKIPFEVCYLVEMQRVTRKNTPAETQQIITRSAVPAKEHFDRINTHVKTIQEHSKAMKSFGLEFPLEAIKLIGRELQALSLIGGRSGILSPRDGGYDAKRSQFLKPTTIKKWALTFIADQRMEKKKIGDERMDFAKKYVKAGEAKGVNISPCSKFVWIDVDMNKNNMVKKLKDHFVMLNDEDIDQCLFILPTREIDWLYPYLQYLEASNRRPNGRPSTRTSCIKYDNFRRKIVEDRFGGEMFLSNIWLKYNTKLGGVNFALKPDASRRYLNDGFLYISVDVCHPAPNDRLLQSVVGVVGMWGITSSNMSYCTRMRVQRKSNDSQSSTIEEVLELGLLVQDIIQSYRARKGKPPTNIVIMRDGVSDGQLDIVIERELDQVLNYLKSLKPRPCLTCLVVQKRHKQRFMREEPIQTRKGDLDFNIQPGTVVDNTVTHPKHHDFYLASHKAIKGTSRPAHIYFRYDENNFKVDEAQQMILSLSFLSPRCTKSTSIPTPVNLADLAAERGKNLVVSWNDDNTTKMKPEDRIKKLNEFLSKVGDQQYLNTLFYV